MRTIRAKKGDNAAIVTRPNGSSYFRLGGQEPQAPFTHYPSRNSVNNASIELVQFTDDEDVKVDEEIYLQDDNMIIYDLIVGPRPKNIKNRK